MVVFKEKAGRGDEKRLHLGHVVVKYQRAPLGVRGHALLLAFKKACAVKLGKAVLIARKMRRDPVHDNADAGIVHDVDKLGKLVGRSVAARRSIVAGDLISPRAGVWVLGQRKKLNVRKAHLCAVFCKLGRNGGIVHAALGRFPRAEVQLVYRHGACKAVFLRTGAHKNLVTPNMRACPNHGRRIYS